MPKAFRATSQGQYRNNPIAIASSSSTLPNSSVGYYPIVPAMQSMPSMSLPSMAGGPVQYPRHMSQDMTYHHSVQQHNPSTLQAPAVQPLPVRASSGAWTPQDDQTLMNARAAGQNWAPIQANYFPNKTPNACRKRHERLMDRRNSDEWDIVKLEVMAKEYMSIRKEMWSMLAERTGEKWAVLEQKCFSSGLKNLQSQARAYSRRERLGGDPYSHAHTMSRESNGGYTDDSGFGSDELGLDAEAEDAYSGVGVDLGTNAYGGSQQRQHQQQQSSSQHQQQQQSHQQLGHGQYAQQNQQSGRSWQHGPQSITPETDGGKGYVDGSSRVFDARYGSQQMMGGMVGSVGGGVHGRDHSLSMQSEYGMRGSSMGSMGIGNIINPGA